VTNVQLTGAGQISTAAGYTYDAEPIAFTVKHVDGTSANHTAALSLVFDGSTWKVLDTSMPAAS
jgi:hypothetical protein